MIYFPHPWVTGTKRETSLSTSRRNTSTVAEKVGALLSKRRETCRRYTTTSETRTINECQFTTALLVPASIIIRRRKKYQRVPFHNCASRQELSPSASFITALLIAPSTSARPDYKRTQDYEYKYKRRRQRKPSQKSLIIFSNASSFNHAYASTIANRMSYAWCDLPVAIARAARQRSPWPSKTAQQEATARTNIVAIYKNLQVPIPP